MPALEWVRKSSPLGIRFWDPTFDQQIKGGLKVSAYRQFEPQIRTIATPSSSGIYVFHHLPGLRSFENRTEPWDRSAPLATEVYVVHVADTNGRFLPVAFMVDAPFPGVYPTGTATASPPGAIGFELFSSAARTPSTNMAQVYCELWDHLQNQPAAHAIVNIRYSDGQIYNGLSDKDGKVSLLLPYPPIDAPIIVSPAVGSMVPLQNQSWTVELRIQYQPSAVQSIDGVSEPNLRTVFLQSPARMLLDEGNAIIKTGIDLDIRYQQTTILQTIDDPGSRLRLIPT